MSDASQCSTSWTEPSSPFAVPSDLNPLFIPFKLSNYLFLVGTSSSSPDTVSIYYHNLNNYTSLLSSLYNTAGTQTDSKLFRSELNNVVSSPSSLHWHLISPENEQTSIFNDSLYPFLSYPSTWFVDESSNDLYIVSPIGTDYESTNSESLWRLHLDIKTDPFPSPNTASPEPVDISYFWHNVSTLLFPVTSSCVIFDDELQTAFLFGGMDSDGQSTNVVQSYNLRDGTWTALSSMTSPRRLSACSPSDNGYIYVFGGNVHDHYGTVERYDIANDEWYPLDDDQEIFPFPRYATSAVQLKQSIYIIGGLIHNDAATSRIGIFDIDSESLNICSDPNHTLPYNRGAATSLVISDTIWTFGGYTDGVTNGNSGNIQYDNTITIGWSESESATAYSVDTVMTNDGSNHSAQTMEEGDVSGDVSGNGVSSKQVHVFGSLSVDSVLVGVLAVIAVLLMVICAYYIMLHVVMRRVKAQEDGTTNPKTNRGGIQSADSSNSTLLEIGDKSQAMAITQMAVEMQHMMEMKKRIRSRTDRSPRLHSDAHNSSCSLDGSERGGTRSHTPTFAEHYAVNHNVYRDYQPIPMNSFVESGTGSSALHDSYRARDHIPSITAKSSTPFQPTPSPFHVAPVSNGRSNTPFEALQKQQVIQWLRDKGIRCTFLCKFYTQTLRHCAVWCLFQFGILIEIEMKEHNECVLLMNVYIESIDTLH